MNVKELFNSLMALALVIIVCFTLLKIVEVIWG